MTLKAILAVAASLYGVSHAPPPALVTMVRTMGLNGDALAAVGASESEISASVSALCNSTLVEQLAQLQTQIAAAEVARRSTAADPSTDEARAASAALEQLQIQRTTIVAAARNLVKSQLGENKAAALANWWSAPPFLPASMRTRSWAASELQAVRTALLAEKTATDRAEAIPAESASVLAIVRADVAVVTATSNLTHQAETTAQLAAALGSSN